MAKIYGFTGNPRTAAVRIVAAYEAIPVDYVELDVANKASYPSEFTSKFPLQKVPALEFNGFNLTETAAIAAYLAAQNDNKNLFGKSKEDKALIVQWSSWANTMLLPALAEWFVPITKGPFNKKASEDGKAATAKLYGYLDQYLSDKTFLVGERITFADIITAVVLQRGSDHVVDPAFIGQYPNVLRYFNTVLRQPEVMSVQGGEPKIIEKPKEYVPAAKEKKEKAAPAPAAPKAEKKPAKKEAEDEEDEPAVPAEPKAKHPCEALGKPTFVLDDWKRTYSNNETKDAMKWFEQNYKPEEYSLWQCDYKYNEELTQVFMSSNLIGGFHTRLEGSRKYLFGNACVYGKNNDSKIRGVYLVRGQEWEPVFSVGPDYESYEFKKLDWSKPEDKELVGLNWAWEDKVDGKEAADGKVFK